MKQSAEHAAGALVDGNTATSKALGIAGAPCGRRVILSHAPASSVNRERRATMIEFLWQAGVWALVFFVCWLVWGRGRE